jgi:serine/threonine protein kinase
VLYELLTGGFPFDADGPLGYLACHITEDPAPLAKVLPEAAGWPPALQELLDRLLLKDCDERPQSARDVVAVLDAILAQLPG